MNVLNTTELFTSKRLILRYINFTSVSYTHIYTLYERNFIHKRHGDNDDTAVMICAFKKPGRAQHLPLTCLTFKEYTEYQNN